MPAVRRARAWRPTNIVAASTAITTSGTDNVESRIQCAQKVTSCASLEPLSTRTKWVHRPTPYAARIAMPSVRRSSDTYFESTTRVSAMGVVSCRRLGTTSGNRQRQSRTALNRATDIAETDEDRLLRRRIDEANLERPGAGRRHEVDQNVDRRVGLQLARQLGSPGDRHAGAGDVDQLELRRLIGQHVVAEVRDHRADLHIDRSGLHEARHTVGAGDL